MSKKELSVQIIIIIIIFALGFLLRFESINLYGVSSAEKAYYQNDYGLPYMYDMDSYYNYRLTENFLKHGYLGDTKIDGMEWDYHSYYPPGVPLDYPPLIVYLTALLYWVINLFSTVPLMVVSIWLPAFIGSLAGVVTFLFARRFTNNYGAAVAGILAVTAPFYFMRTVPGFFDTDMFNILFPILIVWFYVEAVRSKEKYLKIVFTIISAFSMFLFALAWNGWQYLFYVLVITSIIWIFKIKGQKRMNFLKTFSIFLVISLVLVTIFSGYLNILKLVLGPIELFKIFGNQSIWAPWLDVYTLVSELQPPTLTDLVVGIGPVLLGLGIMGSIILLLSNRIERLKNTISGNRNLFINLILIIWALTGALALLEGIRFLLLLIPPLTIISGIVVGIATDTMERNTKNKWKTVISVLVVVLIAIPSIVVIQDNLSNLTPRMNDDMWDAGIWIHNNTTNDTVVISSWVYGHFFSGIADRPVVFDGRLGYIETIPIRNYNPAYIYKDQSPSTAREYWIDKALSTSNESLSKGIFRMLAFSGDSGFLTLNQYTNNTTKSVQILNDILGVNKELANITLMDKYGLKTQESQNVLKYTHPDNPNPTVLVTYDKMIDYGYYIFNFGEWNFNNQSEGNISYSFGQITRSNSTLTSDDGLKMDLNSGEITWNNLTPYCIITVSNGTIKKQYKDINSGFCVVILLDKNESVVLAKRFENSTFTKLILERSNQTTFKVLYQNKNVMVWNVL